MVYSMRCIVVQLILVSAASGNLFGAMRTAQEAMRKAQGRISGIVSHIYPYHMQPTRLLIIGLDIGVGRGYFNIRNLMSYTHQMYKGRDIEFLVEQNGYGSVCAAFSGRTIQCSGLSQDRFKKCKIPASYQPWGGRFTVEICSKRHVSAGFTMAAKGLCPVPGLQGNMCKTDVNECEKYKDKRICSWTLGCVNTYGSYRCKCPPGFKVSSKDFRLCEAEKPKITSPPKDILAMMDSNVLFDCLSSSTAVGVTKWFIGSRLIALRHKNGYKVLLPNRMTLHANGSLELKQVKYGDMGTFHCQVIVGKQGAYVIHKLLVEAKPIVEAGIYVGNKQYATFNFNTGQKFSLRCKVLGLPTPVAQWKTNGQVVTADDEIKINKLQEPTGISGVPHIDVLELHFKSFKNENIGSYVCEAGNKHGTVQVEVKVGV